MKKPEKTPKGESKSSGFFEDRVDVYHFLNPMVRVFALALPIGLFMGFKAFLYVFGFGTVVSIVFVKGMGKAASAAGSLYHGGSNQKDHIAVIKGMYNLANGQRGSGKFEEAEKSFQQILVDYPEELDAMYYLAKLYDLKFDNPEKALGEYRRLKRKIAELNVDYKYEEALNDRINELKDYLGQNG